MEPLVGNPALSYAHVIHRASIKLFTAISTGSLIVHSRVSQILNGLFESQGVRLDTMSAYSRERPREGTS